MGVSSSPRRPSAARRVLLSAIAVTGSLTAAYVVQGIGGWTSATPTTVQAAPLPGTAALSGTVESTAPFKAAACRTRQHDGRRETTQPVEKSPPGTGRKWGWRHAFGGGKGGMKIPPGAMVAPDVHG